LEEEEEEKYFYALAVCSGPLHDLPLVVISSNATCLLASVAATGVNESSSQLTKLLLVYMHSMHKWFVGVYLYTCKSHLYK
jgi:hypothetical protein